VAQLRRRRRIRERPRDDPSGIRSRHHAFRPGQQLRTTVRLGRGDLRTAARHGPPELPGRIDHLDQGRVGHVARTLRGLRVAEVHAGESRSEPPAHGPFVRRHLLPPSSGSRDAHGGEHGCPRYGRPPGQSPLRRHLGVLTSRRTHPRRHTGPRASSESSVPRA
jgi:hypothetical protein